MKLDPRKLRPAELARLLNSTPLGEVAKPHTVYRHQNLAGYRIGDGKRIDLIKYVAWLAVARHIRRPEETTASMPGYEGMKAAAAERNRRLSAQGRDIGPIPEVKNPTRRAAASDDFRLFCETYLPNTFYLPWSDDHMKAVARIEDAVLRGGLYAYAMPRGSGKTVMVETACVWAVLCGYRPFVALIGSDEAHAADMLDSIKTELEANELLLEDFPEVAYPIHRLEGIANRCQGQTCDGERTHIEWTAKHVVLPTIPGSAASGAIIRVAGITGRIRGMKHKCPDGKTVRPSLVVLDDPQTDESARSMSQCANREKILAGAVLGLAGPGVKIAGFMPCTVICPGDMADRILDRDKHPQWQGERTKMMYSFPTNTDLWDQYASIRAESLRSEHRGVEATEFYRNHRDEMDAGAKAAWEARYNPDELSAIQHAMNLKLQDEAAFFAEYQNEPVVEQAEEEILTADQVAEKINGRKRREIPVGCSHVTAFIDVHDKLLFYAVAAWEDDFTGYIVDYGTFPDQRRAYFTSRNATRTLGRVFPRAGKEGAIAAGLKALLDELFTREWPREDGSAMHVGRCLIDSGYEPDVVHAAIRRSPSAALIMPSLGQGITAANKPISEYSRKRGDRIGYYWWIPSSRRRRLLRTVHIDTNYWKTFVHTRLAVMPGDKGCLALFGQKPAEHRLFADHVTAEYRVRTEGRGRKVDEWKLPPSKADNHWFDCLVGCAVAASMLGVSVMDPAAGAGKRVKRRQAAVSYL